MTCIDRWSETIFQLCIFCKRRIIRKVWKERQKPTVVGSFDQSSDYDVLFLRKDWSHICILPWLLTIKTHSLANGARYKIGFSVEITHHNYLIDQSSLLGFFFLFIIFLTGPKDDLPFAYGEKLKGHFWSLICYMLLSYLSTVRALLPTALLKGGWRPPRVASPLLLHMLGVTKKICHISS